MQAKPFLKWAGGKGQLIKQIEHFLPSGLVSGSINKYIEPFIGGGALFFYLANYYHIESFWISDSNRELVLAYQTVQKNVEDLITLLAEIETHYLSLDEEERKDYFYQTRSQFNKQRKVIDFSSYNQSSIKRTAQLIFLNRTCFNGLYRVNSKGDFNVPAGRYKKPKICDVENLRAVSQILQKTQIHHGDFCECEKFVDANSFVYFDPPYKPISKTANFTSYSQQNFDDTQQLRLRDFFRKLDGKGANLLLSNSDPKNYDLTNNFFEIAYEGYIIKCVKAARNINSNALKRGEINEILVMNY